MASRSSAAAGISIVATQAGRELLELLHLRRGQRLAPARELEPRHVLQRQPPPRPRVLEGSDLDLELAPHAVHAEHRHRRTARIEHAGTVARDDVTERPRLERLVAGGVGIVLVDGRAGLGFKWLRGHSVRA